MQNTATFTVMAFFEEKSPKRLRQARQMLGLSQPDLAKILDVDPRTLRRWELGQMPIPRTAVYAVCFLLECHLKNERNQSHA